MTIKDLSEKTKVIERLISLAQKEYCFINFNFEDDVIELTDIDHEAILRLRCGADKKNNSFVLNTNYCENIVELLSITEEFLNAF